jgi:ELWxxDGT repeat protein
MSFLLATVAASLIRNVGGVLFFVAAGPDTGAELWRSDGTAAGTRRVLEALPQSRDPSARP